MAQFAPVAPARVLKGLQIRNKLGSYHLLLAHDILNNKSTYYDLFHDRKDMVKILDNSVIELGTSVDVQKIKQAAHIIKADVIILPDVLLDGQATANNCAKALDVWTKEITTPEYMFGFDWTFMYVPQGKTLEEWVRSAEVLSNDDRVGWWGIPRLFRQHIGSRIDAVEIAKVLNKHRKIHLLGFSDDLIDDVLSARSGVEGIDSAVPLRCADIGVQFELSLGELSGRGTWWDTTNLSYTMEMNIEKMRKWIA